MRLAVVIPSYRVKRHIFSVLEKVPPCVEKIYVVDDACPEQSGNFVQSNASDPRVQVLYHQNNLGVGGATMTGYQKALEEGFEIIVKLDGDGQMDPKKISHLIAPIEKGLADYSKGNRFASVEHIRQMPLVRLIGNSLLSFINKAVTGCWHIMDPTNGYTAVHATALREIPLSKIEKRYFFESDMLFRLSLERAVVIDVPIPAIYGDEKSNLSVTKVLFEFPWQYCKRLIKRIVYSYFLKDFSAASLCLVSGSALTLFGVIFGSLKWMHSQNTGVPATAGTVILAALPILVGVQLLISFLTFDIVSSPKTPLQKL